MNGQRLTDETVHSILSNRRRRHLLILLEEHGTATVDELAPRIAARELNTDPRNVGEDARQRVAISLVHEHLPLLDDHDVVQYDRERRSAALMDVYDELRPHFVGERERVENETIFHRLLPV